MSLETLETKIDEVKIILRFTAFEYITIAVILFIMTMMLVPSIKPRQRGITTKDDLLIIRLQLTPKEINKMYTMITTDSRYGKASATRLK